MKVAQFGEGNFLRSFVDVYFDNLNDKSEDKFEVTIIKPRAGAVPDKFIKQNYAYNVVTRGLRCGKRIESARKIKCVKTIVSPFSDREALLRLARDENLKIIVSNTTEAGIFYGAENKESATTYAALLTLMLFERYASNACGVYILPCELISDNAETLKNCVLQYARAWNLPEQFIEWLKSDNYFVGTLVDRIVSGYPKNAEDEKALFSLLGEEDRLMTVCEPYGLWIIERKGEIEKLLPCGENGVDVEFTDCISPYKIRKVRVLNGSHTNLVPVGLMHGAETVYDCMNNEKLFKFFDETLFDEIVPFVPDVDGVKQFAFAVKDRFSNPYLNHKLSDIALNSVSKWKTRVMPTLNDYYEYKKELPRRIVIGLSYLVAMYGKARKGEDGKFYFEYGNRKITLSDDEKYLTFLAGGGKPEDFVKDFLLNKEQFGYVGELCRAVSENVNKIYAGEELL